MRMNLEKVKIKWRRQESRFSVAKAINLFVVSLWLKYIQIRTQNR